MIEKLMHRQPYERKEGSIQRTATEARQGEIILGRKGRWLWAASFTLVLLIAVVLGFWR